jgi:Zn-finger nucleic acid-binding protein
MKKLSISIDMGAKNNGVFIVKSRDNKIIERKTTCIIIDKNTINFSKKSRRENRHKDRNYKRRRMVKRLLSELVDFSKYDEAQQESLNGLLNNRGYTFLSTEVEFEKFYDETNTFNEKYFKDISKNTTKEKLEEFFTNEFDDEKELLSFLETQINQIVKLTNDLANFINKDKILKDLESLQSDTAPTKFKNFSYMKNLLYRYKYLNIGKNEKEIMSNIIKDDFDKTKIDFSKEFEYINSLEFDKESKESKALIVEDFKSVKDFFVGIQKEIQTGSKPRKKYLKDIKDEIDKLDFIEDKNSLYNLVGNISNLQLRVLRKLYNFNSSHRDKYEIVKRYFKAHHYKKDTEKATREKLFIELEKYNDLKEFLQTTNSLLTIPPYEDMNNRDTYKCNSMLINPNLITDELRNAVDVILKNENFSSLLISYDGVFQKEEDFRVKPSKGNQYIKTDFTYSKYLQRILDATAEITTRELNPRNVFKHMSMFEKGSVSSVKEFKKAFGDDMYFTLEKFATKYFEEEQKITNGIYEESTSIFVKCNTNTSYKNNVKHTLLKPIYSYNFTPDEADIFLKAIESSRGLKTSLELISSEAKKLQNSFYSVVVSCFENQKCVDDKDIKKIVDTLPKTFESIKEILKLQNINSSYLSEIETLTSQNVSRVLNILKQTYEILFKELSGFAKTCKHCSGENALRSDEKLTIGKRLLSDVAKPIDGMLDMMLDRLAFEITQNITQNDIKDINSLDIVLEQNRFEFEENLNDIKRANNSAIKKYKREDKNKLNSKYCPYTGKAFDKGDYDHILPQSKEVYNSKANMIYVSSEGNGQKGAKNYTLENLSDEHLKDIFRTANKQEIEFKIKEGLSTIKKEEFKNFEALKITQQIAMRYALFLRNTPEFTKAFELVKLDKIKTITNGTQKRLARIVYEKLVKKFPNEFKTITINCKTIDSQLVSATRNLLADTEKSLRKEQIQKSHSHCIDAMVVFYLANAKIKGRHSAKKENISTLEPIYNFDDIYLEESTLNNISKNKTFINSTFKQSASVPLFQGTIYSENYFTIIKKDEKYFANNKEVKELNIELLVKYQLLYKNSKNKKVFVKSIEELNIGESYKIDIQKVSNLFFTLFNNQDKSSLEKLKFLDTLRYNTTRKEIINIFFDDKFTKLVDFTTMKDIPPFSKNLFKSVHKRLKNTENLFTTSDDKSSLNHKVLDELLKNMFASKQKVESKEQRKRGKKRHRYTLPCLGQNAKYKIKRGDTWQVLGGENIATKNYIIDGDIKPIPYFTKNTLPLKVADLCDCLLLDENSKSVYEVFIDVSEISSMIDSLKYLVTEANRCTVQVAFNKSGLEDIDFDKIVYFDAGKDDIFKKILENYIENKDLVLNKYIGSIRDGLKGKASLINSNKNTILLQYKAAINKDKKQIILNNL